MAAARELFPAGYGTARGMREASWQDRVDALGRGHYVRYDESTATALGEGAELIINEYRGDLRRMWRAAEGSGDELHRLLQQVPRLGPTGASIFCREAQAVWPRLRPYLDRKALDGAKRLDLPTTPERLAELVPDQDLARFAAALVRTALGDERTRELVAA